MVRRELEALRSAEQGKQAVEAAGAQRNAKLLQQQNAALRAQVVQLQQAAVAAGQQRAGAEAILARLAAKTAAQPCPAF